MIGYEPKIGDEITLNAIIVDITANKNLIIKIKSGGRFLVKDSDVKSIYSKPETPTQDMRKGN